MMLFLLTNTWMAFTVPAQLITATAQPPAIGAAVYTAFFGKIC